MSTLKKHTIKAKSLLPLVAAAALAWPLSASAEGAKSLEGTWEVTATIRDCASGNVIRSVPRMITFAKGGTLTEYTAAGTAAMPIARAPGHGAWEYLGNSSFTYSEKFMRLTAFGAQDGSITETRLLSVSDSGKSYTADGFGFITLANGVNIPTCATETGAKLY